MPRRGRGGNKRGKQLVETNSDPGTADLGASVGSQAGGRPNEKRGRGVRSRGKARSDRSYPVEHGQGGVFSAERQRARGRGRGGGRRTPRQRGERDLNPVSFNLADLGGLNQNEVIERVCKNLKGFVHTLNNKIDVPKDEESMKEALKVIATIASTLDGPSLDASGTIHDDASRVLAEVLSARCAPFHMKMQRYIDGASEQPMLQQLCTTFRILLVSLPESSWGCLPVEVLQGTIKRSGCGEESALGQSMCEVVELKARITEQRRLKNAAKASKGNSEITWDNSEYREIPLIPTWDEVCINKVPTKLRPNIVDGEYENWMHYYDVQFRLLREDFVAPLRRGICDYLNGMTGRNLQDVKVYNSVRILKPEFTHAGISHKVKFDISQFKRYRWEHSKRLIFGSLLCLSPDNFDKIILFATVSDRKPEDLKKGFLSIQFETRTNIQYIFDPKSVFVMVESIAFFEASRHILCSLQTAEVETMPFTQYIIKCDCKSVNPPKYLDASASYYDLSCMYSHQEGSKKPLVFNILDRKQWPIAKDVELDQSQLDALQQALTQEIAIIQGPPGTGKTYIGLKIVEALLRNRKIWDPCRQSPILVMCYTNHALDQFLQGILSIRLPEDDEDSEQRQLMQTCVTPLKSVVPKIVRVGGRCQNEAINEFNVEKLVRKALLPRDMRKQYGICKSNIDDFNRDYYQSWGGIEKEKFFDPKSHKFLKLSELSEFIDEPDHEYQLSQLARTADEYGYEIELWLGLWNQVEITATEDGTIISEVVIDSMYPVVKNDVGEVPEVDATNSAQNDLYGPDDIDKDDNPAEDEEQIDNERNAIVGDIKNNANSAGNDGQIDSEESAIVGTTDEDVIDVQGEADIEESNRMLTEDIEDFKPINFSDDAKNEDILFTVTEEVKDNQSEDDGNIVSSDCSLKATDDNVQNDSDAGEKDDAEVESDVLAADVKPQVSPDTDRKLVRTERYKKAISWQRKPNADLNIKRYLFKTKMSQAQAKAIKNISSLEIKQRWQLYNYWVEKQYQLMVDKKNGYFDEYTELCKELKKAKQMSHHYVFESSDVIGLTTTGAAKNQHIIHMVKPKIVIVEEAAEVLESHIVSALCAGTQHLILIGDHKQLRPKPNEYELVRKYNLDISLFERLIIHQLPHATLNIQHRMRPEIAQLVHPHIYDVLHNHESVLKYDSVKGVFRNMFFVNHEYPEEAENNLMSHANDHEAKFIVALCEYLLQQGYDHSQITVLTPYTGQLLKLKNLMPKARFCGVRATAVDNFQGEENDIILLSLVRSNSNGQLGFLKEPNRVCVSLSRAKKGFYCIGNFKMLREKVPIWEQIISDVESKGYVGDGIQLQCQMHAKSVFIARHEQDFKKFAPNGGCTLPCDYRLKCGHRCTRMCHLQDQNHEKYQCDQPCAKRCPRGHECKELCFIVCPPCGENVMKQITKCGHLQVMPCHQDPEAFMCKEPCSKRCVSGHLCKKACSKPCGKCNEPMEKTILGCGHVQKVPCHQDPTSFLCRAPCSKSCVRGHPCKKTCSEECKCDILVMKEVPQCKHAREMPCYVDPADFTCDVVLEVLCAKKLHRLKQLCGNPKQLCNVIVEKSIPLCSHKHLMQCEQDPAKFFCTAPCEKWLSCFKHKCPKLCGDLPCPTTCEAIVEKTNLCGHITQVACYMSHITSQCTQNCIRILPCGHKCEEICYLPCTTMCRKKVTYRHPCGHTAKQECYKMGKLAMFPCKKVVQKTLACGHSQKLRCHESEANVRCTETKLGTYPCGHKAKVKCWETLTPSQCKEKCQAILMCGHQCSGTCGQCYGRRMHEACPHGFKLSRYCGHTVSALCKGLQDTCNMKYTFSCPHSTIDLACPEPFPLCTKPCSWECPHYRCDRKCHELCNRPRCNERCAKKLSCGHLCYGVCGEPCLSVCLECNEGDFKEMLRELPLRNKKNKVPKGLLYVQQKLCGHIFPVTFMDKHVDSNIPGLVRPIQCPEEGCSGKIEIGFRYGNAQRAVLEDVQQIAEIKIKEDMENVETLQSEIMGSNPTIATHNISILPIIEKYKECILNEKDESQRMPNEKDESQLVHLLVQANNIIEYVERNTIKISIKEFATTCSNLVQLATTTKKSKYQLSQQLINDFSSELYRIVLETHCIVASVGLGSAALLGRRRAIIAEVKDAIAIEPNDRLSATAFREYSKLLQMIHPVPVVVSEPEIFSTKCHWLKCPREHGYYTVGKMAGVPGCPKCAQIL